MAMLQAFPAAYGKIAGVDPATVVAGAAVKSVFGKEGEGPSAHKTKSPPTDLQQSQYDKLFKGGSKPVSHVEALAELDDAAIRQTAPEPLRALFDRCRALLEMPPALGDVL